MAILLSEYPGDLAWEKFASAFGADSDAIHSVAIAVLGAQGAAWLESGIPALEGLSPTEVVSASPDGERIVRTVMMRIP